MPMLTSLPRVTRDPRCYFPSTWRDAIGKPLTTARIRYYEREGFYGEERRLVALDIERRKKEKKKAHKCACGQLTHGAFLYYSYLSRQGYFCPLCLAKERADRDKRSAQEKEFRERMRKEYV